MSIRRIVEDRHPLPEELRDGLRQARLGLGDPAQLARVRAGLDRRLAGTAGGSTPPFVSGGSGWTRGQWLTLLGLSIGALLGVTGLALWSGPTPSALRSSSMQEGAAAEVPPSYLVLGRASEPQPTAEEPVAPVDAGVASRAARPRAEAPGPAAAPALDPGGELEILRLAQAELRSRPFRSLEQVELHQTRYPRGVFAQEREVLRIDALFALQRDGEARERARAFLAQYGSSTHAPRVRSLLGEP